MENERSAAFVTGIPLTFIKSFSPPGFLGFAEIGPDLEAQAVEIDGFIVSLLWT